MTRKQLIGLTAAIWSKVSCASAQNLIADPTFANSTTTTTTTGFTTDGKWQFLQNNPGGTTITFPSNMQFNPNNDGTLYAAPLNSGGSQIQLTNGVLYSYTIKVYGSASDNILLVAGLATEATLVGGGASGATRSGTFTAPASGTNILEFKIAGTDPAMGLTNVDVQIATPEPRSVILCALLAVGVCGVERRRLREIFLKNGKWKMEDAHWQA